MLQGLRPQRRRLRVSRSERSKWFGLQEVGLGQPKMLRMLCKMDLQHCWSLHSCQRLVLNLGQLRSVHSLLQGLQPQGRSLRLGRSERSKWHRMQEVGLGQPEMLRMLCKMDLQHCWSLHSRQRLVLNLGQLRSLHSLLHRL